MEIHWKAPLQAKGFLKLIEIVVAILAFSLVAGFRVTHTVDCIGSHNNTNKNISAHISAKVMYPFKSVELKYNISEFGPQSGTDKESLPTGFMMAGQFFVVWGIFSFFYGIIALLVYMLTTANAGIEWIVNFLVLTDLIFHVVWVLCWFIAALDWAIAQASMNAFITHYVLDKDLRKSYCNDVLNNIPGSYAQAAIADVFGFTSFILWGINIYWIVLDTSFYIQWKAKRRSSSFDEI